jgi:hypothetical protein
MSAPEEVVFLLDVDNTLLNNDQVVADLREHLTEQFGTTSWVTPITSGPCNATGWNVNATRG